MIQNRRAYQLIHCHTRSRLLAGAAAVCGAACGHADLGLYHLLHRGGAPLPDSTQADRAALAALCPKPAAEETCPLLPQQDPAVTLSVIVPVYNGEATIGPCLDSILQQDTGCTVQLDHGAAGSAGCCAGLAPRCAVPLQPDVAAFGFLLCHCIRPAAGNAAGCFPAVLCFVRKGAAARGRTAPPCPLGCPGTAAAGLWAVVPLRQKISVVII